MKPMGQVPSPFAIVMLLGALFGLLALFWRPTLLQTIPISVGLMLFAALIPYYFFDFYAYGARFSIHVLPIATASMIFVLDRSLKIIRWREQVTELSKADKTSILAGFDKKHYTVNKYVIPEKIRIHLSRFNIVLWQTEMFILSLWNSCYLHTQKLEDSRLPPSCFSRLEWRLITLEGLTKLSNAFQIFKPNPIVFGSQHFSSFLTLIIA